MMKKTLYSVPIWILLLLLIFGGSDRTPPPAYAQQVINQSAGPCPTSLGAGASFYPGLMCFRLDTGQMFVWNGSAWSQFALIPTSGTVQLVLSSSIQGTNGQITVTNTGSGTNPLITISLPSAVLTDVFATTRATGIPLNLAGDIVLGKTTQPAVGPGFGALTLRARPGTNPGSCKLVAVAGSSSTEVTIPGLESVGSGC